MARDAPTSMRKVHAKFEIGRVVRHRVHGFRGVVYDVDAQFNHSEEWYRRIATSRPSKDQPWYHLLAENSDKSYYEAYVSEQNLVAEDDPDPVEHPALTEYFSDMVDGVYRPHTRGH